MIEVCSVLGWTVAITGLLTAISEILPFIKRTSGNGIIHTIVHIITRDPKCKDKGNVNNNIV